MLIFTVCAWQTFGNLDLSGLFTRLSTAGSPVVPSASLHILIGLIPVCRDFCCCLWCGENAFVVCESSAITSIKNFINDEKLNEHRRAIGTTLRARTLSTEISLICAIKSCYAGNRNSGALYDQLQLVHVLIGHDELNAYFHAIDFYIIFDLFFQKSFIKLLNFGNLR